MQPREPVDSAPAAVASPERRGGGRTGSPSWPGAWARVRRLAWRPARVAGRVVARATRGAPAVAAPLALATLATASLAGAPSTSRNTWASSRSIGPHAAAPRSTAALLAPPRRTALHPSDGPDVDLRIAVRPSGVRASVTLNLAFLDEILEVPRESEDQLHESEAQGLRPTLAEHLRDGLRIEIDGLPVTPLEHDYDWEPADPNLLPLFPGSGARALIRVRTVLDFPAKSPPERVRVHWSDYPPDTAVADRDEALPLVVNMLLSVNGEDRQIPLRQSEPSFQWRGALQSPLERFEAVPDVAAPPVRTVPLASAAALCAALASWVLGRGRRVPRALALALLVAAPLLWSRGRVAWPAGARSTLPTADEALAIFRPLHANIYRAFDYETESDVYDALARSVDGELLDRLYDEIYGSLVLADEGGAVCRVQRVSLLHSEVESSELNESGRARVTLVARWQVEGAVHHWGHSHWRTNEYRARYALVRRDSGWRIGASQILEQRRVSASPTPPLPRIDPAEVEEL